MNGLPFYSDSSTFFGPDAVAEAIGTPAIVHFEGTGAGKPWHFLNSSPHREIYYRHLRASGWPPQLPEGLSIGNVARRYLPPAAKKMLKSALSPFGYGVSRRDGRTALYKLRGGTPPPAELTGLLRDDHPRLSELRQRYGRVTSPLARHSIWTHRYLSRELQLPFFRGDNAYMWQQREVGHNAGQKHAEYAEYVARRDPRGLLNNLGEDGAFGCLTFSSAATGSMSRDLLDSVNELYFLDRNIGLFQRTDFSVLDIGAGYGRMAHRMSQAVPSLSRYVCADAVAESTYLSEIYLNHRRCSPPAMVVALDELDQIRGSRFDLAINIHSFSEMPHAAVRAWLELLAELRVPRLLIVPNDEDLLLTYEPGGSRIDFMPVLTSLGFKLQIAEPIVIDAGVRARTGLKHHFMLFEAA